MLGKIEGRREGDDRGWDGWMASPTQWTWVWGNSRKDREAWRAAVHGVTKSQTQLSNWTTIAGWVTVTVLLLSFSMECLFNCQSPRHPSFTLLIFLGFLPLSIPIRLCHKCSSLNLRQLVSFQFSKLRLWHLVPSLHGKWKGEKWKQWQTLLFWVPKSLWTATATMKLKNTFSLEGKWKC